VGIAAGTPVVAYDDDGGSKAARLWWMLHVLGEPVAVLDGGLAAWSGTLETSEPRFAPADRAPRPWPADRFVGPDDLPDESRVVYDARTAERYAHGDPTIDPRPGHVPGARSAPWGDNLDDAGRFRSAAELRAAYADAADRGAVAYCGSGVTACHDLLAMTIA
jgi:thiosulfate/3-mercaptopyruvate sulfurtransferase